MSSSPRPFAAANFREPAATVGTAPVGMRPVSPVAAPQAGAVQRIDTPRSAHMEVRNLVKTYRRGSVDIPVLADVSMHVHPGELLAVVGQSGSGKSTLLHLMGTLDVPTGGEIHYGGRRIDNLPVSQRDRLRNEQFGMIFQSYHLQPELNTLENVLMPLMIRHSMLSYTMQRRAFKQRGMQLLEKVGLAHRVQHRPRELSGGEMQRTAIARALIGSPTLLLADEPTGNLDQKTGQEILAILRTLNRQENLSIVMVTHDMSIAAQADRIVRLVAGQVESV